MSRAALAHDVKSAEGSKTKSGPGMLRASKPADAYEREADSVAERAGPGTGRMPSWSLSNVRMGASPESEAAGPAKQGNVPPIVHDALGSPGRPLDTSARGFFEQRFGRNFGQVRIHTGEDSAEAAGSLHSSAFTLGNDIVFARGRYAPSTPKGRLLLAHELSHVQQQRHAVRSPEPAVDLPTSSHEVQARSLFDTDIQPVSSQRIQCAPEGDQFALDGDVVNSVGRAAFGDTPWAFLKAVIEGFVNGLKSDLQAGRGEEAKGHLHGLFVPWNAGKFYLGYLVGLVLGLISPITDLVKGIIGIIKLAGSALEWLAKWSPVGVAISPERQQKIATIAQRFSDLAVQFGNAIVEFAKDPKGSAKKFSDFLDSMMNLALGQARTMGANAAHSIFDFLKEDYYDMGESIGKVIGGLIAQVLLLVFSDAIGNLISEAASMIGKAAEFVAGKAVELIEWVASFASKVIGKIREAVNGALKLFKGLANSLIDAFDALKALFTESEELAGGLKAAPAGGGELSAVPKAPNVMESRMVTSTRTSPAKVEDLKPPKIHPSKAGEVTTPKTTPKVHEPAPKELTKPKLGETELDPNHKFSLGVGKERLQQIQAGEKNFAIDRAMTFDIDEVLPVGEANIKPQRAVGRARSSYNRQLLDPNTNQRTKGLGIDMRELRANRGELKPVSVTKDPNVLVTRRFSEIEEMDRIFDRAVASVKDANKLTPTGLKAAINREIRRIITEAAGPDAVAVRKALKDIGFERVPKRGFALQKSP